MSTPAPLNSQAFTAPSTSVAGTTARCDIRELISLAVRGLVPMLDVDKQMFCYRLLCTERGLVREGLSHRYTAMTLLGLKELESTGADTPFDIYSIYKSFIHEPTWIRGVADIGLLAWLTAAFEPERITDFFRKHDCETALQRFPDAREGRTMELAWFLSGLAHAADACPKLIGTLTDLSVETYHRLEANQGEHGLFGHSSTQKSLSGRLRGRIGSFADQVYPTYAMAKFAKAFHVDDPMGAALECARAICGAQGKSGQWWWLYDSRTGRVSSRYPVYSVHQHGMAPMCLFAVEEATGQSFRENIYRGLRWIYGANELNADMRDLSQALIWRCILPGNWPAKFWEIAASVIRPTNQDKRMRSLEVLYEQRPYEFGWLLYAFARKSVTGTMTEVV
jgi:hypothetical protein